MISLPPVSYTHLDVYKRQFPGMPHRFVWTPDPGHGYQITFEDGKPVSYCTIPEHGTLGPDPNTKIPLGD